MPESAKKLPWHGDPEKVVAHWPEHWPMALTTFVDQREKSGTGDFSRDPAPAKITVLAKPQGRYCCLPNSESESCSWWASETDEAPPMPPELLTGEPLEDLDLLLAATADETTLDEPPPFNGGWIASIGYELCSHLEPSVDPRPNLSDQPRWPVLEMLWCPVALVHDGTTNQWWAVGPWADTDLNRMKSALETDARKNQKAINCRATSRGLSDQAYIQKVTDVLNYIAAGDVFQVNLTQQFTATITGSPRQLAKRVCREPQAHFGAYLELGLWSTENRVPRWLASLSPELFLSVDPATREVTTRPIKGTLPADQPVRTLLDSEKDKAELHMIIDLMRNDLGRVCKYGSITVSRDRWIETYPTVHHAVGEVTGILKPTVTPSSLIKATFPPGSVTGAPKVRAMQIIRELESQARGPYCGAVGVFGNNGSIILNVSIRTLWAHSKPTAPGRQFEAEMHYGAGGGIVADSEPAAEYQESLQKMAVVEDLLTQRAPETTPLTV